MFRLVEKEGHKIGIMYTIHLYECIHEFLHVYGVYMYMHIHICICIGLYE